MIFFMLINLKLLTIADFFSLNIAEHEHFSDNNSWHFHVYKQRKCSRSAELSMKKV